MILPTTCLAALLAAPMTAPAAPRARLDHVPVAVRDLDVAVATYTALGFRIKPGRPHANTIRNAHIRFADGTELELITATARADALAAAYVDLLETREGAAYLSLAGGTIDAIARALGPLAADAERTTAPAFDWLAFPAASPLGYLFFIDLRSRPPDLPEQLLHPSTAHGLHAVWIARGAARAERNLFARLDASFDGQVVALPGGSAAIVRLDRGAVYLLPDPAAHPITGVTVAVADLDRAVAVLPAATRAVAGTGRDARGRWIRLPPAVTHGLWLELLETAATAPGR